MPTLMATSGSAYVTGTVPHCPIRVCALDGKERGLDLKCLGLTSVEALHVESPSRDEQATREAAFPLWDRRGLRGVSERPWHSAPGRVTLLPMNRLPLASPIFEGGHPGLGRELFVQLHLHAEFKGAGRDGLSRCELAIHLGSQGFEVATW